MNTLMKLICMFRILINSTFGKMLTYFGVFVCSTSFKEPSAHVASVKNILENHASYLMSGKELSKLVAFVKGTQFDLVVGKAFCCTF